MTPNTTFHGPKRMRKTSKKSDLFCFGSTNVDCVYRVIFLKTNRWFYVDFAIYFESKFRNGAKTFVVCGDHLRLFTK